MTTLRPTRRQVLLSGAAAGASLLVRFPWPVARRAVAQDQDPALLGAYIEIASDGRITIVAPVPEIGQGVRTALPMIVAEELGADWSSVHVRQAPAHERYGAQAVGGSDSVADYWLPLRQAGAEARERLIRAAAARWDVAPAACRVERGHVVETGGTRRLPFGDVAAEAARLAPIDDPPLKAEADFVLVGLSTPRVDLAAIVDGSAVYGLDVVQPGQRHAVVARCPVPGGRLRDVDDTAARAVPGVLDVVRIDPLVLPDYSYGSVRGGVAVIASSTWAAIQGRERLELEWDEGPVADWEPSRLRDAFERHKVGRGAVVVRSEGDQDAAGQDEGERELVAEYELPPLAHVCLEPVGFTADVRGDTCTCWGATQDPRDLQGLLSGLLGLPLEQVHVHATLEGGGFGRRLSVDYGVEAALVSRAARAPVKVLWTREDDLRQDYYRSPSMHRMEARLDPSDELRAWRHHILSAPLRASIAGPTVDHPELYELDGAVDIPYAIPSIRVEHTPLTFPFLLGAWRSVAHSFNTFAVESFLDEIARATGRDPLRLRLDLLQPERRLELQLPLPGRRGRPVIDTGRLRRVLQAVGQASDWSRPRAAGIGRGLACCVFKQTYVAQVAEVSVEDGVPRVHRVFTAIDCGRVINPDGVEAQVEGGVMDGTATVLTWGIRIARGRVEQSNLHDHPLLRIDQAPEVHTTLVGGDAPPSGCGEPPYPAVAPAIVNAIAAATGRRIRRLPVRPGDLG